MTHELSDTGNDRIAMGANMTPFDLIIAEIQAYYDEAKNWASDGFEIENQAQADALDALDAALLRSSQSADALRVSEKKPLDEQIDAIQARFNPYIQPKKGKVDLARSTLNPIRAKWKTKLAEEKAAAALKARQEADAERAKAEDAIRASAGNLEAREKAEEQLGLAKEAERFANKSEKAATTGLGMGSVWTPTVSDLNEAIRHYWKAEPDQFEALVLSLAKRDVDKSIREIPGIKITETKKAL